MKIIDSHEEPTSMVTGQGTLNAYNFIFFPQLVYLSNLFILLLTSTTKSVGQMKNKMQRQITEL